jgi:superfamily II DNA/RNA helicase
MRELNSFNKNILETFASRQAYTTIKGHYIPIIMNNITDESAMTIDKRKYYIQSYEFTMLGFLIDENEFEVAPAVSRVLTVIEFEKESFKRGRRKNITDVFLQNCKEKYLEGEFIEQMEQDKKSKWLVFNDNGNVLVRYQELLEKKGIKTAMLDGGNQKLIEKTLQDYKEGAVQVLLLNSMIEGAGMNLENTTHLLFMHKTEEKFINQVVGRAQRYGRTRPLNIIMLFNKNE